MNKNKIITIGEIYQIFKKYGDLNINVNTPYGFHKIKHCDITAKNSKVFKIKTNSKELLCSPEHKVKTGKTKFTKVLNLKFGENVHTIDGLEEIQTIEILPIKKDLFDIEVDKVHQYYSNGIVSHNSAILDILCFSIYDKATRATKAIHVLNNSKTWFKCKFSFDYNGQEYFIERFGQKNEKTGNVRVDVKFWTFDEDGNERLLNGEDRDKTNYAIRDYLGSYDDFVMTAISTQYDNQSFVEKTQRERKDLLYKFLDISIYDDLFKVAKEINKEQLVLIKEFEKENLFDKSSNIFSKITFHEEKIQRVESLHEELKVKIKEHNENIIKLSTKLNLVSEHLDIEEIQEKSQKISMELESLISSLNSTQIELNEFKDQKIILESSLEIENLEDFINDKTLELEFKEFTQELNLLDRNKNKLENEIKIHEQKIQHLENHEYDPNCEFCCKNQFVIDAKKSVDLIPKLKDDLFLSLERISSLESKQFQVQLDLNKRKEKLEKINKISILNSKIDLSEERIKSLKYKGSSLKEQLKKIQLDEKKYYENEERISENEHLHEKINDLRSDLVKLEKLEVDTQKEYRNLHGNLTSFKKEYQTLQQKINHNNELIKDSRIYELYTQALSRDGVPYLILEKVLPVIENEVNEVLSQVVNFTVRLESTEEKYIHAFIDYGQNQTWPVELTSGMERFILSLAFRTSLTEITSLPRAPFLAIDEGFGVLDSDNLLSMGKLFEFLKSRYNYLLVISHIESMKDLVEKKINIEKVNGYSIINLQEN